MAVLNPHRSDRENVNEVQDELREYLAQAKQDRLELSRGDLLEVLTTANTAVNALQRILALVDRFRSEAAKGGPASPVARAIAEEVEAALRGQR